MDIFQNFSVQPLLFQDANVENEFLKSIISVMSPTFCYIQKTSA